MQKQYKKVLPNANQVADRFHLQQNLLQAKKDAIGRVLPEKVKVTNICRNNDNLKVLEDAKKLINYAVEQISYLKKLTPCFIAWS